MLKIKTYKNRIHQSTILFLGTIILLSSISFEAIGQQDAQYTHYMYNTQAVNPAYAGSRDALTITGIHRSQWAGFEGAPITQSFTMHSPLRNPSLGVGLSVVQDKIGPTVFGSYFADFTYKIKFNNDHTLAFGMKGGLSTIRADFTSLSSVTAGDNALQSNVSGYLLPNVGTGVYYYSKRFYAGFSVPKLVQSNYTQQISNLTALSDGEQRHYYLISGALITLNESFDLKPFGFIRMTNGAPVEMDLTTTIIYKQKISFGGMVRFGDAYGALLAVYLTEQLELGYSYDWSYSLGAYNPQSGSHEVVLRYDFIFSKKKHIRSPRNFYF